MPRRLSAPLNPPSPSPAPRQRTGPSGRGCGFRCRPGGGCCRGRAPRPRCPATATATATGRDPLQGGMIGQRGGARVRHRAILQSQCPAWRRARRVSGKRHPALSLLSPWPSELSTRHNFTVFPQQQPGHRPMTVSSAAMRMAMREPWRRPCVGSTLHAAGGA